VQNMFSPAGFTGRDPGREKSQLVKDKGVRL